MSIKGCIHGKASCLNKEDEVSQAHILKSFRDHFLPGRALGPFRSLRGNDGGLLPAMMPRYKEHAKRCKSATALYERLPLHLLLGREGWWGSRYSIQPYAGRAAAESNDRTAEYSPLQLEKLLIHAIHSLPVTPLSDDKGRSIQWFRVGVWNLIMKAEARLFAL